jgi:hypothetical protein
MRLQASRSASLRASAAHLNVKIKDLQFELRRMWDWYSDEISKAGGLTFKASSLIAKALHPMPRQARRSGWTHSRRSRRGRATGMRRSGASSTRPNSGGLLNLAVVGGLFRIAIGAVISQLSLVEFKITLMQANRTLHPIEEYPDRQLARLASTNYPSGLGRRFFKRLAPRSLRRT